MTTPNDGAHVPEILPAERDGGSLTTTGSTALSLAHLKEMEAAVDTRVQLLDRIKAVIDHRVSPDCFDRFEDPGKGMTIRRNKNYSDVVAATIGASFAYLKDPDGRPLFTRVNYQDDVGPYYVYECFGIASIPGMVSIECSGAASSRDKFLSRGGKLDVSEVDERFIRQMAATECRKKGILALLGLSGDSNEEEMNRVGKNAGSMKGHTFQKGSQGGNTDNGEQSDQKGEIARMCQALLQAGFTREGLPQPTTADAVCQTITTSDKFKGWRSIKGISANGLKITFEQVKKTFESVVGSQAADPAPAQEAPQDGPPPDGTPPADGGEDLPW